MIITIKDSDTDVRLIEARLVYDFPVKLGERSAIEVTGILRGGDWERE